ncbi:MAG: FAD-dependent oxidoreductase [Gemmataceae bacterium]
MSASAPRAVVIGGGVVGCACAHYLREAGLAVTLVEKNAVGSGCSHANCGFVSPSHVLPLAGPGVIGKTLWTLLQKDSPLKIRLRWDPALWAWLLRFALRCNRPAMLEAGHALAALLKSSRELYGELFRAGVLDAEWEERGTLFVFRTLKEMDHYAQTDKLLREEFDTPATRLDGDALCVREPALKPGLAGAWFNPNDAHLRPDRLLSSWGSALVSRGVEVREQCAFVGLEKAGKQVRAVVTSQGRFEADHVVVAAGVWTSLLKEQIGTRLPIVPGKGYSITMARPSRCPQIPIIFEEDRVAVTPMRSGYRLGSTMEFAGYDDRLDRRRLEILRRAARFYLHTPEAEPVTEEWWGWRPMVADGKPIIGRLRGFDNLLVAAGHSMLGVALGTGTGKLVTELVTGVTPHLDPAPYSPTRF